MAEAQASGRSRSVAYVTTDADEADEDGFIGEGSENPRETGVAGVTFGPDESEADSTVSVEQPLPRQRRCSICGQQGHTARTCSAEGAAGIATRAPRKPSKEAVGAVAPMLVGTLNFCAVSTFGSTCGLTDMEAKILIPSVQRMMERLPAATATKAALILDPLIILTVFVMWGRRIIEVKNAEAKQKYAVEPFERMRASGVAGTTFHENGTANGMPTESVSNSVAASYQQTNGIVDEGITDPSYGIPDSIRDSFDANF